MKTKLFLAAALAFMLFGCVPSLHKLYTADVEVFEESLLGAWTSGDNLWEFQRVDQPGNDQTEAKLYYALQITDNNGTPAKFEAHLVRLDEMLFLDIYPKDAPPVDNDWYKMHMLAVHTFMRVELKDEALSIAVMNPDAMNKLVEKDPDVIKHEIVKDDRMVLTASTAELQQFLKDYADHDEIFGEAEDFQRPVPDPNEVEGK